MKNKKKKVLLIVAAAVLVLAAGAGAWYWFSQKNADPVPVFQFSHVGMTEYWGDSQESHGPVSTDKIQTVYISNTQNVTEIAVKQGDRVKKGDLLISFDTTLSDLALERKRLEVEKLKLQLEDAKTRLKEIRSMKPMVIPKEEPTEEDENLGAALEGDYKISDNRDYDGSSQKKPLICWVKDSYVIQDALLETLRLRAEEFQTINANDPAKQPATEETTPEQQAEGDGETGDGETDGETLPEEPTEPIKVHVSQFYVIFKTTKGNMSLGQRLTWTGTLVKKTSGDFGFRFYNADAVSDHMLTDMGQEETKKPEIDYGSGYTAAQIAQMRSEQEKTIKDIEFKIKMAEAEYKIALTEVTDGKVYAKIDGEVVSVLTEEEARTKGQPIVKVSGGGGFYVQGSISELEKEKMQIGQEVTVNDWNTGMTYTGTVQSLGDFPAPGNGWNGMGNPNASYYPFTVFVNEEADLQEGRYVSITYSAGSSENGVYLQTPFLRTEQGQSYVYVQGADGRLEQRFVKTGKSLWGSYVEILSGLTEEDMVAFPYGKNVREGAATVEGDMSDLYG